jgi:hypothetical protein
MIILMLVLLLAAVLIIAAFTEPVRIRFQLDSSVMDMRAQIKWLVVRAEARVIDYKVHLEVYAAGLRVYSDFLKKKGRQGGAALWQNASKLSAKVKALDLQDTRIRISYGLNEPLLTGIFCAAIAFIEELLQYADIEQSPEFCRRANFSALKRRQI